MKNPIQSVIEILKFLFDLSPTHQVLIGLKEKKMYLDHNPPFSHTSTFQLNLVK